MVDGLTSLPKTGTNITSWSKSMNASYVISVLIYSTDIMIVIEIDLFTDKPSKKPLDFVMVAGGILQSPASG